MSDEVNFEGWAIDLCSLLDAVEAAAPIAAEPLFVGGNFILTPQMIAREALAQLESNMVMLGNLEHFK